MMLREIGLVLFLASVGIKAGANFWETVVQGDGLKFVYTGFLITIIPILIVGTIARLKYKFNYFTIMGMIGHLYSPASTGIRQSGLLQGGTSSGIFNRLSAKHVSQDPDGTTHHTALLRRTITHPLRSGQQQKASTTILQNT